MGHLQHVDISGAYGILRASKDIAEHIYVDDAPPNTHTSPTDSATQ